MAPTDKRCEWRASFAPAQDGDRVVQHTCSEPAETRMPNGKFYCTRPRDSVGRVRPRAAGSELTC
jgi:hypothetical protein